MVKDRVIVIYADTWEELTLEMIGWYHDHCWLYYSGPIDDVPENLQEFIKEDKNYVFLCEEAIPYKPNENEEN